MTRILLVRHGLSEWNAAGRWQGWADPPLAPLGEEQARSAAGRVGAVDVVVASDLQRARRTAELLAPAAGPVRVDAGLRERDVGAFTGLTRDEIEVRFPGVLDTHPVVPPGGEPWPAVLARVRSALARIAADADGRVVLAVSHGGVIGSLERHLEVGAGPVPNLAGRWFDVDGERVEPGDRVLLVDPDVAPVTTPRAL
jgi:broad specificity phosphatase PhoE